MLSEETRNKIDKEELKRIWWGNSEEEKVESRIKIVKGLIQKKAKSALQDLIQSLKETKEFISVLAKTA